MFLTLLSLIAIFLFDRTLGKAIAPQRNNKDFIRRDSRGMQRAKEMLWSDQANFYTNPLKSATRDGFAFEQSSVPIPNDGQAHFKQLSATMTQVPATATTNAPKYQIDKCKPTVNNATQNLLLFFVQNDPAITILSLLLPRDFARPAIATALNGDFSLQLIVESLSTGADHQDAPATILDDSFKLIDVFLASEGAYPAPTILRNFVGAG
jgi:hypothetical protein